MLLLPLLLCSLLFCSLLFSSRLSTLSIPSCCCITFWAMPHWPTPYLSFLFYPHGFRKRYLMTTATSQWGPRPYIARCVKNSMGEWCTATVWSVDKLWSASVLRFVSWKRHQWEWKWTWLPSVFHHKSFDTVLYHSHTWSCTIFALKM